jgi:hypothetical protein
MFYSMSYCVNRAALLPKVYPPHPNFTETEELWSISRQWNKLEYNLISALFTIFFKISTFIHNTYYKNV